ncbi:unnamed protein product [Caenorhabditis angaria]|uniref:Dolichyl-diphosphooligosaccharide--protein glycosyltransferase 48 kDa subunit n=1 Tax=Caenorhabditis angaria TaxID=860376 RepID=A0A9P1ICI8_9PELO|nr:unnamed protein product [Caenorhabditis angaria]
MKWLIVLLVILQNTLADRVLVLGETAAIKDTHSVYLNSITARGHELTIRAADDANLALFKHGELIFEHLIVLAPGVQVFGGSLSSSEISKFVDAGGNVLVAAGSNIGDAIRELAVENGFEFDAPGTAVIDHHNYDTSLDSGDHTTLVINKNQLINAQLIVGDASKLKPVLFRGIGLVAGRQNRLALSIIKGTTTSYSFDPKAQRVTNPVIAGTRTLLVGGLQARNNARIVFTGSADLFSNAFFGAKVNSANPSVQDKNAQSGNAALADAITKWVLKENGVIRVKKVNHHLVGETQPPPQEYTITDDVVYTIEIEELKNGKWVPFQGKDVQLEFVRIDPFVRTVLQNKNGVLTANFKLPDVYGVFKFLVDYRRVGYTHLYDVQQMSVRPLWHTQYERFIRSAYPYYASSFSMMIGLVLFSIVYLYHKEDRTTGVATKKSEDKKKQ